MVKIVAEIGCNHNGSREMAKELVHKARECGADAVKFQTFKAKALISKIAPKAEYQKITTGEADSQLEMTAKLEMPNKDYLALREYAHREGLECFSAPFDLDSADFLYHAGQRIWKIPAGEITNLPLLEKIGKMEIEDKVVLLSTGMATIEEIRAAVDILERTSSTRPDITIMHCNTEYPTPDPDVNVSAIADLKKHFPGYKLGFSDHSLGWLSATLSVAFGVSLIEKHFTLDKSLPGPDHRASANPKELWALCENVHRAELLLGESRKKVTDSERKNKIVARKSIVANRDIKKGEIFDEENLTCKRPGNGISPMKWYDVLGRRAEQDFSYDELIKAEGIPWQE